MCGGVWQYEWVWLGVVVLVGVVGCGSMSGRNWVWQYGWAWLGVAV